MGEGRVRALSFAASRYSRSPKAALTPALSRSTGRGRL
jgi:hypothetical protein